MNNSTKRIWSTVIIVIAVFVAAHAIYRFCLRKSVPDTVDASAVAAVISQNDCMACHSLESKKPFYSSFPILKKQMAQHIRTAIRYFDMSPVMSDLENIDEVSLAKLENTVLTGSMPIADYKMVHWGTSFNDKEKALLLSWIKDVRAAKYPNADAAAEFANEPVRPVPASLPTDPAKVALGKAMYNDTRISLDNTISCASCHILADASEEIAELLVARDVLLPADDADLETGTSGHEDLPDAELVMKPPQVAKSLLIRLLRPELERHGHLDGEKRRHHQRRH